MKNMVLWLLLLGLLLLFWQNPYAINPGAANMPPSLAYLFGTDALGRDVLSRVVAGFVNSLAITAIAIGIALVIGIAVGLITALSPKWLGERIVVCVDFMNSLPTIFYILLLASLIQPNLWTLGVIIGCCSWMTIARQVRIVLLAERQQPYILMAKQIGTTKLHRVRRYYIPMLVPIISVTVIQEAIHAILTEATISFLGLGIPINMPTLGNLLIDAQTYFLLGAWWNVLFPGLFICLALCLLLQLKKFIQKGGRGNVASTAANGSLWGGFYRTRRFFFVAGWRKGRANR